MIFYVLLDNVIVFDGWIIFKFKGVGVMRFLGLLRFVMLLILKCFFGVKGLYMFVGDCFYLVGVLNGLIKFKFFFLVFWIIFGFSFCVVMY